MDPSTTAAAWPPGAESHGSGLPGGEIDSKLDLAARSRMASLRTSMFGASAEPARVGRFVVLETLGAGGMGVVHAAYDPRLDRKIALKLVKPEVAAAGTNGEARLLREAQAMARLSHPNVVQIHEVGAWEGRVFIAMELVAGRSLATWLEAQPRGWREVVHMFAEAGRGLAAAHAAGMVHRDFKPENVLVGDDGRVRVTDFGLARGGTGESEAGETWREPGDPLAAIVEGMSVGTAAFAGTPRFMSPEQFLGEPATAASDQFSFCVALYVALHGVHPFVGEDRATLAKAVIAGERREPARVRIPRRIHRALVRGLGRVPGRRFAGMPELLREIEPRAPWQRVASTAILGLAGGAFISILLESTDPCAPGALLRDVWDEQQRATIERAYEEAEMVDAGLVWTSSARALDAYAEKWAHEYTRSCEAQRSSGSSHPLYDRWNECLIRKLEVFRSLTRMLTLGDATSLRGAPAAAAGLDDASVCADELRLSLGLEKVPNEQRHVLANLHGALADARALELLGHLDRSVARTERVVREASELGHAPTLAQALHQQGRLANHAHDFFKARHSLQVALSLAIKSQHDVIMPELYSVLIHTVLASESSVGDAQRMLDEADAWIERGGGPAQRSRLDVSRALVMGHRGDHQAAVQVLQRALETETATHGADALATAMVRMQLANTLADLGETEQAVVEHRAVVATVTALVGTHHPLSFDTRYNLAVALMDLESPAAQAEAERLLREVSQTMNAVDGVDPMELADCWLALAKIAFDRGEYDSAQVGVDAALAIYARRPGHADRALALTFAGALHFEAGRLDASLAAHTEVRAIWVEARGRASELVGVADGNIGAVLLAKGDVEGAIRRYEDAVDTIEAALGSSTQLLQEPLIGLGTALVRQGRGCEARQPMVRARELMQEHGAPPDEVEQIDLLVNQSALLCG